MSKGQKKVRGYGILAVWMIMTILCSVPMAHGFDMQTNPCADAAKKYCIDVIPGGGRTVKCLLEHESDLSIFCKDWIHDAFEKTDDLVSACSRERARMCPYSDRAALVYCLNANLEALSQDCRDKVKDLIGRF